MPGDVSGGPPTRYPARVRLGEVCVFCGSSAGGRPAYAEAAAELGRELARRDIGLVFGGGAVGLMGVVADATMAAGGRVTGVIPEGLFSPEVAHERVTTLHRVASMHERKALMYRLADAFVALPGGLGTLEELAETLTWGQIGLHDKAVGLLDTDGFFRPLRSFFDHAVGEGFLKPRNLERLVVAAQPAPLLDQLAEAAAGRTARVDTRPL
jgi:uncharacterized protein (TIGR00730 family)